MNTPLLQPETTLDLAARFPENPLLTPQDIHPSTPGLKDECLLYPTALRFDERTWPLLRVAKKPMKARVYPGGFALVITLMLMMLLALLALGMMGLSAVSLRSTSQDEAHCTARANARMALLMAIGQLQEHAGDDRRVSAAADQITADPEGRETTARDGRRYWTGIYDAWEAGAKSRPEPNLRTWLVSGPDAENVDAPSQSAGSENMVRLVGAGTASEMEKDWVEAHKIPLENNGLKTGNIAWWTGDEGIKAMLATAPSNAAANLAQVRDRLQSAPNHAVEVATHAGLQPFEGISRTDPKREVLTGWSQTSFFASDRNAPKGLFHDLTAHHSGLLVDVRSGGFRRDLSMEFEIERSTVNDTPLYSVATDPGINFEELRNYYRFHNALIPVSGTYTTGGSIPPNTNGLVIARDLDAAKADDFFHFKQPVILSYQEVYSFKVVEVVDTGGNKINRLYLAVDPILTFWNPLDVPVVVPAGTYFSVDYTALPYSFTVKVGGTVYNCPIVSTVSGSTITEARDNNYMGLRAGRLDQLVFKPGEVIKVSQSRDLIVMGTELTHFLEGKVGFNFGGGVARPMRTLQGGHIDLQDDNVITYTITPNGYTYGQDNLSGRSTSGKNLHTRHFGAFFNQYNIGDGRANPALLREASFGGASVDYAFGKSRLLKGVFRSSDPAVSPSTKPPSDRIYANDPKNAAVFRSFGESETRPLSVAQLKEAKAPVFMRSTIVKTENSSLTGTRGMMRFNPRAHYVDFYDLSVTERDVLPYELVFEPLNSWVNDKLETSVNGNAYFGGGYTAGDGNSFITTHSVPHGPIHSLASLQHSMANGFALQRPAPQYQMFGARDPMLPQISHAIGNSYAPGVLAPDATSNIISGNRTIADHSYLANEALWDTWFFSSVSPHQSAAYANKEDQESVARKFLDGSGKLPIQHYYPELGGRSVGEIMDALFSSGKPTEQSIALMASLIRVDGMFNVNSTSVQAWRVLLSNLAGEKIVTRSELGQLSETNVQLGIPVAGLMSPSADIANGHGTVSASAHAQWLGHRILSETEITALAEHIVREVRKRGPFLSLADFINRRPGNNRELARAGAIQSALDSDDITINEAYRNGNRAVASATASRFPFPEAEEGAKSAGIPGIVKQADVLTPLAPILSARSDSFLIRAYGETLDTSGKVIAKAWCEALVRRTARYVNSDDSPETLPQNLSDHTNRVFGRRFEIVSFRWLNPSEI